MKGILRVIPSEACCKSERAMVMRVAPSKKLIEDLVGGPLMMIEHFATILFEGQIYNVFPLRAREGNQAPNARASWLRIQSQLRKDGWAGMKPQRQGPILGTVVLLFGDREFFSAVARRLLTMSLLFDQDEGTTSPTGLGLGTRLAP